MVVFYPRLLEEVIPFAAGATRSISIPRDRFIQKIELRLTITGTTAATVSAHEDNPMSLVRGIRLVANGNDVKLAASMTDLHYVDQYEYGTAPERFIQTATGLPAGSDLGRAAVVADVGSIEPKNPFDISSLLPAHTFSSLELFVDWGTSADLGTGYTVADARITVTLREADLTPEELREVEPMLKLYETFIEKTIDAAYPYYGFIVDLPTGNQLFRTVLTAVRAGIRSDTQITAFKVTQESPVKAELLTDGWYESQARDKLQYGIETVVRGICIIDYEKEIGGLDLRGLKAGDVKFRASTIAPSGTTKARLLNLEIAGVPP